MNEVLEYHQNQIQDSNILSRLKLTKYKYFLFSAHREENVDSDQNLKEKLINILNELAKEFKLPTAINFQPILEPRRGLMIWASN